MCGIAGIFNFKNNSISKSDEFIIDNMKHRGPDASGIWKSNDDKLKFYHTRLSIVDLSDIANQPMDYNDKYKIVYNGEIYNYKTLKNKLEDRGHKFKTTSDTEVILALYDEFAKDSFDMLEGIFAFAIFDILKQKLIICRDIFGVKPFYFFHNSNYFIFSSEVRLIAKINNQLSESSSGWVGFGMLGSVPEPFTIYENVYALKPGNVEEIDQFGNKSTFSYNSVEKIASNAQNDFNENETIDCDISESIKNNLIGDVRKSVFLSSGFDSCLISSISKNYDKSITNLSLSFEEFISTEKDELPKAINFSKNHNIKIISKYFSLKDYEEYRNIFFRYMDQPSIDGFNIFLISLLAKNNNFKIGLAGIGGDECFGSYPSFKNIPKMHYLSNFKKRSQMTELLNHKTHFLNNSFFKKIASILKFSGSIESLYFLQRSLNLPNELNNVFEKDFIIDGIQKLEIFERMENTHKNIKNLQIKISLLELEWYMRNQLLRDADVFGMANSVEIRVPLLSKKILYKSYLKMNKNQINKKFLKENYYPDLEFSLKKLGFSFPIKSWIMQEKKLKSLSNLEWLKYISSNYKKK